MREMEPDIRLRCERDNENSQHRWDYRNTREKYLMNANVIILFLILFFHLTVI